MTPPDDTDIAEIYVEVRKQWIILKRDGDCLDNRRCISEYLVTKYLELQLRLS